MNKADLQRLKSMIGCLAMLVTLGLATGCSVNADATDEINQVKKVNGIEEHEHLHITIGGQTYIFRECSDKIGRISVSDSNAASSYTVYDSHDNKIISGYTTSDVNVSYVKTFEQEDFIQGMEEDMIEKGAKLELK